MHFFPMTCIKKKILNKFKLLNREKATKMDFTPLSEGGFMHSKVSFFIQKKTLNQT